MHDWRTNAEIATALFVIADPIATIPIFINLTSGQSHDERVRTAQVTALTVAAVLVAGPGAISTIIIYAHQAGDIYDIAFLVLAGLLVGLSVWIALRMADPIRRLLGKTGINIISRLAGLVLAAIAVEFIASGLVQLMPGLAR